MVDLVATHGELKLHHSGDRPAIMMQAFDVGTPFSYIGLTLIPAWTNNHMPSKVWDVIIHSLNFSGCAIEVWK